MKNLARSIAFESFSLYLLSQIFPGVIIIGGLPTLLLGGLVLSLLSFILKPILNVLTAPFALITFGTMSVVVNAVILFVLTKIVHQVVIHAFTLPGMSFMGFIVPKISFNAFFAFLVVAAGQIMIKYFLLWLTEA